MSTINLAPLIISACIIQLSTITLLLAFTSPSSFIRPAALPVLISCIYIIVINTKDVTRPSWAALLTAFDICFFLQYVEMGLLSKWSFEAKGPSSQTSAPNGKTSSNGEGTLIKRIKFGFHSMCSFRDIGTSYEVKGVPPFSSKDPKYVPTRKQILLKSILKFCICYLVIDIIESVPQPPNITALYSAQNIPVFTRLGEISLEESIQRIVGSAVFWGVIYCVLNILQALLCIIFVGLGLNGAEEWRPLMGPLSRAYTVRGFWGTFWHQGTRKTFAYPANYFIDTTLCLPKGTLISRYSKIFLTFFISGMVHHICDYARSLSWQESGAVRFFCTQAFGIMVEDAVQAIYRLVSGEKRDGRHVKVWRRVVGWVWTVVFLLFWSTPAWFFPIAIGEKLIPLSIVGLAARWL